MKYLLTYILSWIEHKSIIKIILQTKKEKRRRIGRRNDQLKKIMFYEYLFKMIYVLWISFLGIVNLLFNGMKFRWFELIYCERLRLILRKSEKISLNNWLWVLCRIFPLFSGSCLLIISYCLNSLAKRFPDLFLLWRCWQWDHRKRKRRWYNPELSKASFFSLKR